MKKPKSDPVFVYTSQCHSALAQKPALTMPDGARVGLDIGHRPKTENVIGLGGWRCTECRKPCLVSRTRKRVRDEATV